MTHELSAGPHWGNTTYPVSQPAGAGCGWPVPVHSPVPGVAIYDTTGKPAVMIGPEVTIQPIPPQCGQCPEQATCVYSYGAGDFAACSAHDPTRQPGWLTVAAPMFFTYRTLVSPFAAVTHTTGHLGIAQPWR